MAWPPCKKRKVIIKACVDKLHIILSTWSKTKHPETPKYLPLNS